MRRFLICLCSLLFLLPLGGCAGGEINPHDLLSDFKGAYPALPAGYTYLSTAEEWEEGYLSPSLAHALYTEDNGENAFSLCRQYAIYLCTGDAGGEIAFFTCATRADAARVAAMCEARLFRVRQILPTSAIQQGARVLQKGNTVCMFLLPDNARAEAICRRLF